MNTTLRNFLYKNIGEKTLISWEVPDDFHQWYESIIINRSPFSEKYIRPVSNTISRLFKQSVFITKKGIQVNGGWVIKFSSLSEFGIIEATFNERPLLVISLISNNSNSYGFQLLGVSEEISKEKIIKVLSSYLKYNDKLVLVNNIKT